ncbi:MAG: N-6 DNA methylase [Pseudomonadota bacterium]
MRRAFSAVRSEGGLLPGDLLARIEAGDRSLPGLDPASYDLLAHETLGEAVNRAWARLVGAWRAFREAAATAPEHDRGTTLTRTRWLLPLFYELGYGHLGAARAVEVDGRSFAISHARDATPIHLVSWRYDLDKRLPGVSGAAASSPHGLVQDLLNRSDTHLWGLVSNGLCLRVLRDHHSLTGKAFVEFDLEAIFDGGLYDEFRLLWLVCHASRVQAANPEECALERWFQVARDEGVQALERLRGGVEQALCHFGTGLLRHPANRRLREDLASGALSTRALYRQLLRLAYRLIFLFVAEDRRVLLDPEAPREARERFARYYATRRLRDLADRKRGGPHGDLWVQLRTLMGLLHDGYPPLGLPAFGSFLWSPGACPAVDAADLSNEHLLAALRALCVLDDGGLRRPVAWSLVAADELGGIYESLMELHPRVTRESGGETFTLQSAAGHERKTTGSYYTPTSLVDCLLDSTLDPVLAEAERQPDPTRALLEIRVVDSACGSGHFLVAAARRIAERLARVRTGDCEPAPPDHQRALREVVGRCIHGVDLNEMAVELCKVALWMEAIEPGKPLSFLDAHIQQGNALLGATPNLLAEGVPDDAWQPLAGDEPATAKALRARNRKERQGQGDLFAAYWAADAAGGYHDAAVQARRVEEAPDDSLEAVRAKESAWRRLQSSPEHKDALLQADLWCSAFVWPKQPDHEAAAPTHELFQRVRRDAAACPTDTRQEVRRLARDYGFFHWHLAFPAVFTPVRGAAGAVTGWEGGFDVVLGNPPWERIKLQEKEFFAARAPDVAGAVNAAARKRAIARLEAEEPELWAEWQAALRQADGEARLVRDSGRFPLCGRGDVNTYSLFAELNRGLLRGVGRAGCIVPTGIATDATTQFFFNDLMGSGELACLYGFENEGKLFRGIDHRVNFCALVMAGSRLPRPARLAAFLRHPDVLREPGRTYELTAADLMLLNPNTGTCPVFRTGRDAEITKAIYRRVPVLWREEGADGNPWGVSFKRMLDMANDSGLFRTRATLEAEGWHLEGNIFVRGGARMLPLYEAKMIYHFDHRFGDFGKVAPGERGHILPQASDAEHQDPEYTNLPRYWVEEREVDGRLAGLWDRGWLLGWRDVTDARSSVRTVVATVVPRAAVGHTMPLFFTTGSGSSLAVGLAANLSAVALDYIGRQMIGGVHPTRSGSPY